MAVDTTIRRPQAPAAPIEVIPFAAGFGAAMATTDARVIDLFRNLGLNLLTYMQIIDDLRDACPPDGPLLDYEQGKKTIPLVFFADGGTPQDGAGNGSILSASARAAQFREAFEKSRAQLFTAILAETYLNRAKADLATLKGTLKDGAVNNLEGFIQGVEFDPQGIIPSP